jgi:hypothetical protein
MVVSYPAMVLLYLSEKAHGSTYRFTDKGAQYRKDSILYFHPHQDLFGSRCDLEKQRSKIKICIILQDKKYGKVLIEIVREYSRLQAGDESATSYPFDVYPFNWFTIYCGSSDGGAVRKIWTWSGMISTALIVSPISMAFP